MASLSFLSKCPSPLDPYNIELDIIVKKNEVYCGTLWTKNAKNLMFSIIFMSFCFISSFISFILVTSLLIYQITVYYIIVIFSMYKEYLLAWATIFDFTLILIYYWQNNLNKFAGCLVNGIHIYVLTYVYSSSYVTAIAYFWWWFSNNNDNGDE